MKFKRFKIGKYFFEFTSMFFAVIAAFALNNWNDNRRDAKAEEKILKEIRNGLVSDLEDIKANTNGHDLGMKACDFFTKLVNNMSVNQDSTQLNFFYLTSDNTSIINNSGYESLKSKGLEVIKNDSIRRQIITLYESDYQKMYKYEETYPAFQIYGNHGAPINELLAPYMKFDRSGNFLSIEQPINFSKKERNLFFSYVWRIYVTRFNLINEYRKTEEKVQLLLERIDRELEER